MSNMNDFEIVDGVLTKYTGPGGDIMIPSGVREIGRDAFRSNWKMLGNVTSIQIPEGVTCISREAFSGSWNLREVRLPESLEIIEDRAFSDCIKLTTIHLPQKLRSIGDGAFLRCKSLIEIRIPENVTRIPSRIRMFKSRKSITALLKHSNRTLRLRGLCRQGIPLWIKYANFQFDPGHRKQAWWLTRTPGNEKGQPIAVYCMDGEMFVHGRYGGVAMIRPAIWVK